MKISIILVRGSLALAGTSLACTLVVGTFVVGTLAADAATAPRTVSAFLCDSAEHAIAFADARARGDGEEIAMDRVGRAAKAEVCGRWAGRAAVESEAVTLKGGVAYKITAYRFTEDGRRAFGAETTFAPVASGWDL